MAAKGKKQKVKWVTINQRKRKYTHEQKPIISLVHSTENIITQMPKEKTES
jgi:hypothetical protein